MKGEVRKVTTLAEMAVEVLTTADGRAKTALGRAHAARWFAARAAGTSLPVGQAQPPDFPARPDKPERPGIVKALTERIAEGLDPYRTTGIDATVARNLSRAMEALGIRPSRRSQEVRGYRLDRLLE